MEAVVEVVSAKPQVTVFVSIAVLSVCGGNSNVAQVYFKQCSVYQVFIHRYVVLAIAVMGKMEEM